MLLLLISILRHCSFKVKYTLIYPYYVINSFYLNKVSSFWDNLKLVRTTQEQKGNVPFQGYVCRLHCVQISTDLLLVINLKMCQQSY